MFSFFSSYKDIKGFVKLNLYAYLLCFASIVVGLIVGIILVAGGSMSETIYSTITLSLEDLIVKDYSWSSMFFGFIIKLLLPVLIIILLSLTKITRGLSLVYIGYQAMLLGASIYSLILDRGLAGAINILFFVIPINFLVFSILASTFVIMLKRAKLKMLGHLSVLHSFKLVISKLIKLAIFIIVVAIVYSVIYPLIVRSVVVVHY